MRDAPRTARSASIVWSLLLGCSLLYFFTINEADNDLWGHVLFGREILAAGAAPHVATHTYTAAGHPWTDHEWLSQVILATVYNWAGSPGLLLLKFAIALTTCLVLFGTMRGATEDASAWGLAGLVVIAVLARGFAVRPQIFTYCNVALTLALLGRYQRTRGAAPWLLPPLFLVWANLHGGFILGLAIVALFATADARHRGAAAIRSWLALIASAAVTVLNPYGVRLFTYLWHELSRAQSHPISEWQPAAFTAYHVPFFVMLGLFVVTLPFVPRWRDRDWRVLLALGMGYFAIRHQRHTPVFALCAAAPLAEQLAAVSTWLTRRTSGGLQPTARRLIALAMMVLALVQLAFTAGRWRADGLQLVFDPAGYPTAAVSMLQRVDGPVNLAVPSDWGEYVLWFLAPNVSVSLDGRFTTLFPDAVVADNFNFFAGAPRWQRLIDAYPTDAALVPIGSACPVGSLADWQIVFIDPVARIYARTGTRAWAQLRGLSSRPTQTVGTFP